MSKLNIKINVPRLYNELGGITKDHWLVSITQVTWRCKKIIVKLKMQTLTEFEQGLTHYFQREFTEAIRCFKQVLQIDSQDKAAQIYLSRCKNYS